MADDDVLCGNDRPGQTGQGAVVARRAVETGSEGHHIRALLRGAAGRGDSGIADGQTDVCAPSEGGLHDVGR